MKNEHILAIDNKVFSHLDTLAQQVFYFYDFQVNQRDIVIMQRDRLEKDPTYRQVIPYTVVANELGEVFVYRRTAKAGDSRLHNQDSIGFGGHLDLIDVVHNDSVISLEGSIARCSDREMQEELGISGNSEVFAYIVDDSTEVNRVHVGALSLLEVEKSQVSLESKEEGIEVLGWFRPSDLDTANLESWSQLATEVLSSAIEGELL